MLAHGTHDWPCTRTNQAVLFGRTIFKAIRKFIIFQSTINFASTVIVFLGPFMGFDFPLTLIQLLWLNLVGYACKHGLEIRISSLGNVNGP